MYVCTYIPALVYSRMRLLKNVQLHTVFFFLINADGFRKQSQINIICENVIKMVFKIFPLFTLILFVVVGR